LKNKNKKEGENNYVRYVEINFVNESNQIIAECLIDTGSPISFIKISKVGYISKSPVLSLYYGLNKSYLKTYEKVLCYVMKNLDKNTF